MEHSLTIYDLLILAGVPSIITIVFQLIIGRFRDKRRKDISDADVTRKALQALLRDRLRTHYIHYMDTGWVDLDDKSNFSNMYNIYHSLGKNGVMDGMCKQVLNLPTQPPPGFKYTRRRTDCID